MTEPNDDRPAQGRRRLGPPSWVTVAVILAVGALFVAWMLWGGYLLRWLGLPGQSHNMYKVTIENHSSQAVVVSVLGLDVPMRPCSVRRELPLTAAPYDGPLDVEVKDTEGRLLATWQLTVPKPFWKYVYEPHIRFPEEGGGDCPPDVRKEYAVVIRNQSKRDIDVTLTGIHLGAVPSRGEERFGPIPGDWAVEPKLVLRDSNGRLLGYPHDYSQGGAPVDYDLGQTPVRELIIFDGW